jgi:hypothetical protein
MERPTLTDYADLIVDLFGQLTQVYTKTFHLNRFKEGGTKQTLHFAYQHMID